MFRKLSKKTMPRSVAIRIFLLLILLGFLYIEFSSKRSTLSQEEYYEVVRQGMVVRASELNVGVVYGGNKIEHYFTISNPTDSPIVIDSWSTSCSCSVIDPKQVTIPSKGEVKVKGMIDISALYKDLYFKPTHEMLRHICHG